MDIEKSRVVRFHQSVCALGTEQNPIPLPPITIKLAIPDFDGLLPITALGADLEVNLPWWDGALDQMRLQAGWKPFVPDTPGDPEDADLVGTPYVIKTSSDGPNTTFQLYVPQNLLLNGVYLLRVRAQSFPGAVSDWSVSVRVEVDTVAPGGGVLPPLLFDSRVATSLKVTDDDIVDGKLPAFLPHYEGIARGDHLTPYVRTNALDNDAVDLPSIDNLPEYIVLGFTEQELLDVGNGPSIFTYAVKDMAGNQDNANPVVLNIQLRTNPEQILAPLVPLADDGLITDADARTPVRVDIPAYGNARAGDEIIVHWGTQASAPGTLTAADLVNNPFIGIELSYALIFDAGNGSIAVTYDIFRGGVLVGTSPATTVNVDLTLAPGPDPDPVTPEHENLLPLNVISNSGAGEENVIPPEDYREDAIALIPWLAKEGDDFYLEDDRIQLYWNGQNVLATSYEVSAQDVTDKQDLRFTVPSAIITAEPVGEIPVTYTVARDVGTGEENTALSPDQLVLVTSPDALPGKGIIDAPAFPVLNVNQAIGLAQLLDGPTGKYNPVRTRTDYDNVEVGDTVELFFVGYDQLTGGSLVPGAAYNPQPYALTAADLTRTYYEFPVPAVHHIAVCSQGAVEAYVVIKNTNGSVMSDSYRVFCDVKRPGSPDCNDLTP